MPNRLGARQSPYLLAHQHNPIDWYPWGEDAFTEAKRRGVPVLVSIGYHTCHWCHVMARESFEDPGIAELVNKQLVCVKVDREEMPEVDSYYMLAAGAFTSHLGWPLNVFVTPDGEPFYAATYLPPTPRGDLPSFTDVVNAVTSAWLGRTGEVKSSATALTQSLRQALAARPAGEPADIEWEGVFQRLLDAEDKRFGGFAGDNKFPMAPVIDFMLDAHPRKDVVAFAHRMLETMAASDLRDHIEGGFFRYATKPDWTIPHYERMLTDNALLLSCYARAGMSEVASSIVGFLKNVMVVPGGLASSQHSESVIDGRVSEGGYYLLDEAGRALVDPPELDRKVITGWMGMVIAGLAHAEKAGVTGSASWGEELASDILARHRPEPGVLHRLSIDGVVSAAPATLEDFGGLAWGLIELGLVTGNPQWCVAARELVDECVSAGDGVRMVNPGGGDPIIRRLSGGHSDSSEGATPSGEALIAKAATVIAALTGDDSYRSRARETVSAGIPSVVGQPLAAGGYASALLRTGEEHVVIVVVEDDPAGPIGVVAKTVVSGRASVLCVSRAQAGEFVDAGFGLFHGREGNQPAAYVCRGFVCDRPDVEPEGFRRHLVSLGLLADGESVVSP
jgi:uncharacterized protein YyaL (SSP411 family)